MPAALCGPHANLVRGAGPGAPPAAATPRHGPWALGRARASRAAPAVRSPWGCSESPTSAGILTCTPRPRDGDPTGDCSSLTHGQGPTCKDLPRGQVLPKPARRAQCCHHGSRHRDCPERVSAFVPSPGTSHLPGEGCGTPQCQTGLTTNPSSWSVSPVPRATGRGRSPRVPQPDLCRVSFTQGRPAPVTLQETLSQPHSDLLNRKL